MFQKEIIIISPNTTIYEFIVSNDITLPKNFFIKLWQYKQKLTELDQEKIDIIIIDQEKIKNSIRKANFDLMINLTNQNYPHELKINKPFCSSEFSKILHNAINITKRNLFLYINNQFFYNKRLSQITTNNEIITLTEKENELLKMLLTNDSYTASKQNILEEIWQFSPEINTKTIESHIHRLNQKIPGNIISINNDNCNIAINNIL